eukprot:CAMPEP_0184690364 /NCGR_PEP_ID=MMETSP0312-20130426/31188_1 /TAXON_ID=31354 /ORGANISM="Compsopogon coeruleus, Strain SAG 36.94" /LENGTH=48 /DNA_ID= /DNA_START= /DNA_END= /DNA_ORIENTATION=
MVNIRAGDMSGDERMLDQRDGPKMIIMAISSARVARFFRKRGFQDVMR